jgi:hypothetical protein
MKWAERVERDNRVAAFLRLAQQNPVAVAEAEE